MMFRFLYLYASKVFYTVMFLTINAVSLFLYDKYVSVQINTIDLNRVLKDPTALNKFLSQEINEEQYKELITKNVQIVDETVRKIMRDNPNTLLLIKDAVVGSEYAGQKIKDITNELFKNTQNNLYK